MSDFQFPPLVLTAWRATYDSLHGYARALNLTRRALTPRQKHWGHISLRVNATGLTTTPIPYKGGAFEVALDLIHHRVSVATSRGEEWSARLRGQPLSQFWCELTGALGAMGITPEGVTPDYADTAGVYDALQVETYWQALSRVDLLLKQFQGELWQETSPVQFWAHHFDLAMLWFSGRRVPGQDPNDEENADEQMNFGFSVGDATIPEAYFYVTAYPLPEGFVGAPLPSGAYWQTEGWKGAVLPYKRLVESKEPDAQLLDFWRSAQKLGAERMRDA